MEVEIKRFCTADDFAGATTLTLQKYGPEIFGYLVAVARTDADAGEAFSIFSEDLWKGVAKFRWEASMRTWAYTLARNALRRHARSPAERAQRVPLSQSPAIHEVANRVRTATLDYLRTEVKDRVAELRKELDPEDQTLFVLRISRKMSWAEIAQVMADDHESASDSDSDTDEMIKREAARYRKRFERAKNTLAELVRDRGLLRKD